MQTSLKIWYKKQGAYALIIRDSIKYTPKHFGSKEAQYKLSVCRDFQKIR